MESGANQAGNAVAFDLDPANGFDDVTSDPALQQTLSATYGTPSAMDAWVGGLAEDPVGQGLVGELVRAVLIDQFERLRDGDRFFYARFGSDLRRFVDRQRLSTILGRNSGARVQTNVFKLAPGQ